MRLNVLCAAQGVSSLGDGLTLVALMLVLQAQNAAPWTVSLLALLGLLPSVLLGPLVAPLLDRLETTRILLVTFSLRAAVGIVLAFTTPLPGILAVVALASMISAIDNPAMALLVPETLEPDASPVIGYARLSTWRSLGSIAGPAAAGVCVQLWGPRPALLADAASFAILAGVVSVLRVRHEPPAMPVGPKATWWRQIQAGPAALGSDRVVASAVVSLAIAIVFTAMVIVAEVFFVRADLHASPALYGALVTAQAIGRLAGSMVIAPRVPVARQPMLLTCGGALMGVALLATGASRVIPLAFAGLFLVGVANSLQSLAIRAVIRDRTAPDTQGRAFAALMASNNGATMLGTLAGAPVVGAFGGAGTLVVAGVGTLLATLGAAPALLHRQARALRDAQRTM